MAVEHSFVNRLINHFAKNIVAHPHRLWLWIVLPFVVMSVFWFRFDIDLSTDAFLFNNDPALRQYREYKKQFGSDNIILIAVSGKVFTPEFLTKLYGLQDALYKKIGHVRDVTSVFDPVDRFLVGPSAIGTSGEPDNFLEHLKAASPEQLQAMQESLTANPLYTGLILNKAGSVTSIIVNLTDGKNIKVGEGEINQNFTFADYNVIYKNIQGIVKEYQSDDFKVAVTGSPVMMPAIFNYMIGDGVLMFTLLFVIIIIFLAIFFKRILGIVLPLLIIIITLVSTIGLMFMAGIPITLVTMIWPPLLMAIAAESAIHLLSAFFRLYDRGLPKEHALHQAITKTSLPIIVCALTTAVGIFSFFFSGIKPIHDFGLFAGLGVLLAAYYCLLIIPLVIMILPVRRDKLTQHARLTQDEALHNQPHGFIDHALLWCARISYKRPKTIVIIFSSIFVVALIGSTGLKLHHKPIEWLPQDAQIRLDTNLIDRELSGSNYLNIVVDSGSDGGVFDPAFITKLQAFVTHAETYTKDNLKVGKVISYIDVLAAVQAGVSIGQPVNATGATSDENAFLFNLAQQYSKEMLSHFVDAKNRAVSITIKLEDLDAGIFSSYINYLNKYLADNFKTSNTGAKESFYITGLVPLFARVLYVTLTGMVNSYGFSLISITILMVLFLRSLKFGLIAMIPTLMPVFSMVALTAFVGIKLDLFVTLAGSVILGIAIDNSIHFFHGFREYYNHHKYSCREALQATLIHSGRAMLTVTIVLGCGFAVFIAGRMTNFRNFGIVSSWAILVAFLGYIFLTPALLSLVYKKKDLQLEKRN